MFKQIDHIAIAVDDLDVAVRLYEEKFHAKISHREYIERDGVEIAVIEVGATSIELIAPRSEKSPIHGYLAKKGPGIHHIAFEVDDIESAVAALRAAGVRLIDEKPRPGKEGSLVAFLHPESTQKILYELVQKKRS